jgi:hypothetical protein
LASFHQEVIGAAFFTQSNLRLTAEHLSKYRPTFFNYINPTAIAAA